MTIRDLQRQATREAALQDAAVAAFDADLRRVYRRLAALVRTALATWETDAEGRTVTSAANLVRLLALRRQARRLVRDAGFDEAASIAVSGPLDTLAASIIRSHGGAVVGPNLAQLLQAWKDLRLADLLGVADEAARVIARVALDGTIGLRSVDRLILDVARALELSQRQARTVYDTAVSIFSRQVELSQAEGTPDELFVYVGPIDQRMRPFCEDWIGKVRTREFWDRLDNGQSGGVGNVMVFAGGWNCRHALKRVSRLDDEVIALAGSDDRAPGVAAQLAAVA